jgi:hypothetical protein
MWAEIMTNFKGLLWNLSGGTGGKPQKHVGVACVPTEISTRIPAVLLSQTFLKNDSILNTLYLKNVKKKTVTRVECNTH